jgi:hypothetical protein
MEHQSDDANCEYPFRGTRLEFGPRRRAGSVMDPVVNQIHRDKSVV